MASQAAESSSVGCRHRPKEKCPVAAPQDRRSTDDECKQKPRAVIE